MGKQQKQRPANLNEIASRYLAGASLRGLASELKVTHLTMKRWMRECGIKTRLRIEQHNLTLDPVKDMQIRQEYESGQTSHQLATKHGLSGVTIIKAIRRAGGRIRTAREANRDNILALVAQQRHFTDEQESLMAADYIAGMSSGRIATKWRCSKGVVFSALRRQQTPKRVCTCQHSLDEAAFDKADCNPEAAYYVGLLMADGSVDGKGHLQFSLSGEDGNHVDDFKRFLKATHPVSIRTPKTQFASAKPCKTISITSRRLVGALASYGIVPNKSNPEFGRPVARLQNNPHFWRGMICGDGYLSIMNSRGSILPVIGLVGLKIHMEQFRDYVLTITPAGGQVKPRMSIWQFKVTGSHALAVARVLFEGQSVCLPRKLAIAHEMLAREKVKPLKQHKIYLEFGGRKMSYSDWERHLGLRRGSVYERIRRGWSVEQTLATPRATAGIVSP